MIMLFPGYYKSRTEPFYSNFPEADTILLNKEYSMKFHPLFSLFLLTILTACQSIPDSRGGCGGFRLGDSLLS